MLQCKNNSWHFAKVQVKQAAQLRVGAHSKVSHHIAPEISKFQMLATSQSSSYSREAGSIWHAARGSC
jgi:hypothetical protein